MAGALRGTGLKARCGAVASAAVLGLGWAAPAAAETLAEERFQYRPARDANGGRITASLEHVVTWQPAPAA